MILGKVAAPSAACCSFWPRVYEQALNNNLTTFFTQPGFFWSDGLMAMLNEHNRAACWLRIDPEDQDPAELLLSLIASARRIIPNAGEATLDAMRASPGPVAGWEPLFAQLGQELVDLLPGNCFLVLEHLHRLGQFEQAVNHLLNIFLPWISRRFPCLLTSEKPLPVGGLPGASVEHHVNELRFDLPSAMALFRERNCSLGADYLHTALQIVDGRAVALSGLCSAFELLDHNYIKKTVLEAKSSEQLFNLLTQPLLTNMQPDAYEAQAVASQLTYSHPNLVAASIGVNMSLSGPWFQPLSEGWMVVCHIWNKSLKSAFQIQTRIINTALIRTADFLFAQGASDWAIRIYLECGAISNAARALAGVADRFLDLGLWETLDKWLKRLPQEVLEEWPSLVYCQGELAAFRGDTEKAKAAFQGASQLFANHQDMDGYCKSKLAESALAVNQDDSNQAWSSALMASTMASRFGLSHQSDWANWQLGRLAGAANKLDDAVAFLGQINQKKHEPAFDHLFVQAIVLAQDLQEAKKQRDFHRQAYLEQQKSEEEIANRLNQLLSTPADMVKAMLPDQNWSQIHPILKFSSLLPARTMGSLTRPGLWQKVRRALERVRLSKLLPQNSAEYQSVQGQPALPLVQPVLFLPQLEQEMKIEEATPITSTDDNENRNELNQTPHSVAALTTVPGNQSINKDANIIVETGSNKGEDFETKDLSASAAPSLVVYYLGPFQAFYNDQLIENWPLRKALAIFKYLVIHRQKFVSKEILMETFWPETEPESARRNLHQAIYTLRHSLKDSSDYQSIIFANDRYRLNPDLKVWIDVEEFEHHCAMGKQFEKEKKAEQAVLEYEPAIALYRGDFMSDDLYEEWTANFRRSLWQEFLTMAYRLVEIYASRKEYSAAAAFCQRILNLDDTQEEAHLSLMKFYLAQGKRNQAIQQYYLCRQALKAAINLSPSPEMQELYKQAIKK